MKQTLPQKSNQLKARFKRADHAQSKGRDRDHPFARLFYSVELRQRLFDWIFHLMADSLVAFAEPHTTDLGEKRGGDVVKKVLITKVKVNDYFTVLFIVFDPVRCRPLPASRTLLLSKSFSSFPFIALADAGNRQPKRRSRRSYLKLFLGWRAGPRFTQAAAVATEVACLLNPPFDSVFGNHFSSVNGPGWLLGR